MRNKLTKRKTVCAYFLATIDEQARTKFWPESLPRKSAIAAAKELNKGSTLQAFVIRLEISTGSLFWNQQIHYPQSAKGKTLLTVPPPRKWIQNKSKRSTRKV